MVVVVEVVEVEIELWFGVPGVPERRGQADLSVEAAEPGMVFTMSGAAPERLCSQISCPAQCSCRWRSPQAAQPVAVFASSCSLTTPVLAVFLSTAPAAEWLTDSSTVSSRFRAFVASTILMPE